MDLSELLTEPVPARKVQALSGGTDIGVSAVAKSDKPHPLLQHTVAATIGVIGGKWKVRVLAVLANDGRQRFAAVRRKIPGLSERMLTRQLRELESDGIIERHVLAHVPPHVEYALTAHGRSLRPVVTALCKWGEKHLARKA